jgi:hypothetical protein
MATKMSRYALDPTRSVINWPPPPVIQICRSVYPDKKEILTDLEHRFLQSKFLTFGLEKLFFKTLIFREIVKCFVTSLLLQGGESLRSPGTQLSHGRGAGGGDLTW